MKEITFRQLQTNTEWMRDLPVVITRYGRPIAKVIVYTKETPPRTEGSVPLHDPFNPQPKSEIKGRKMK